MKKMVRLTEMRIRCKRVAALLALCLVVGCGNETSQKGQVADWSDYPQFKKELNASHSVVKEIGARRAKVEARKKEMIAIMREKLGEKDERKVIEALADNAEWKSLNAKAAEIYAEFEKQRQEMLSLVRRQMNQGKSSK